MGVHSNRLIFLHYLLILKKSGYNQDEMTPEAKDLIVNLLKLDENERITKNGSAVLRKHPFFVGINWENLRTLDAPIFPHRKQGDTVTAKNFSELEKNNPFLKNSIYQDLNINEVVLFKLL